MRLGVTGVETGEAYVAAPEEARVAQLWVQDSLDENDIALSEITFCVIDLETTGTGADAAVTEIGAAKVRGGERLGEFQTLVNPRTPIPGFITAMTGISNKMVEHAPGIDQVFGPLVEFARGCVMVAHNARFDMGFILRDAERLGFDWPSRVVVDTLSVARRTIPRHDIANYQLSTLSQYFRVSHDPTHRALDDVLATIDVLHGLLERIGNQGVRTLNDLMAYTHTLSRTRRSRRGWAADLPSGPGVYCFVRDAERGHEVLYVGTSTNIRRRVANYFTANETRARMDEMVALSTGVEAIECSTALEAAVVELRLIGAHQPPYNRRSKQPHHTWLKLTREPLPRAAIVRRPLADDATYAGPFAGRGSAEAAAAALTTAFALRPCKQRLSLTRARDPCALAEMGTCSAPCTLTNLDVYLDVAEYARASLTGDVTAVRRANHVRIATLADQERYEEAGEILTQMRVFEAGLRRGARLRSVAGCPQIVAARQLGDTWEIHVVRYGQLAAAGVARPGNDPQHVADMLATTAATIAPGVAGLPAGRIEETELIAAWLERPGVRLLDIDGQWAWPVNTG